MLINTAKDNESLIHTHALADPDVALNVTADPWNLKGDEASVVVGRDVITPGVFALEGGRKPIEPFVLIRDQLFSLVRFGSLDLVDVFGMDFFGRKVTRFADVFRGLDYKQSTSTSLTKTGGDTEWPAEMVDGLIVVNEDERSLSATATRRITSITTTTNLDDTLNWDRPMGMAIEGDKFHILYGKTYDKRGIWVFNGRKLWLLQTGSYVQYLDLGEGLEGQRWDITRISRNMLMFVNPKYAARIVHLDEPSSTRLSTNSTLAGMIAPVKPDDVEIPGVLEDNSWLMKADGSGGSMSAGTCRIKIRAVNLDDDAESRFVQVYDEDNPTVDFLTVVGSDRVSVWNELNDSAIGPPPLHERWTHLEIWRTTAAGVEYFLEKRVEIPRLMSEQSAEAEFSFTGGIYRTDPLIRNAGAGPAATDDAINGQALDQAALVAPQDADDATLETGPASPNDAWVLGMYAIQSMGGAVSTIALRADDRLITSPANWNLPDVDGSMWRGLFIRNLNALVAERYFECTLADTELQGRPVLTVDDLVAGGPPPMCRKVASLGGVTICMGKADQDTVNPVASSRNFFGVHYSWVPGGRTIHDRDFLDPSDQDSALRDIFVNYKFKDGDVFVVTHFKGDNIVPATEHRIESKTSNATIQLEGLISVSGAVDVEGHIRRPYELDWPTIKSDEDIWYSRTDIFAPESFPLRTLQVSSFGDSFRNMVSVSNYIAVLMDSGVHLLFRVGTRLVKDTVAAVGQGTPWERSVVVVTNTVLWASPEGPKAMTVTTEVASTGMRAKIDILGGTAIRQWFRDAFDAGEEIDGGVDQVNHCVRWRRRLTDGTYQACQYSYRTDRWTLLDDDTGIAYAATSAAESPAGTSPVLYSVNSSGAVFQVNYQGLPHPYDGKVVQAILDDSFTSSRSRPGIPQFFLGINKVGAFSGAMLSDVVRFRSSNSEVDGQSRIITSADVNGISFDFVSGLAVGDEFTIGATRFRYRPAPLAGKSPTRMKTLDALTIRALPGPRNGPDGPWPDPPDGRITVRVFRGYDDDPVDEVLREVPIFDEDNVAGVTADRISKARGSGTALEIELEMEETRSDFRLELVEAEVREESDQLADVSTTE